MSFLSTYNNPNTWEAKAVGPNVVTIMGSARQYNQSSRPADGIENGLDLPTFDMYVKYVQQTGTRHSAVLGTFEQHVFVGQGRSFNVSRRSTVVARKHAGPVEFQGASLVSYQELRPFIQDLLVLHHPYLQKKEAVIGLVGFAWDIRRGMSDLLTVAAPAIDLEYAEYGNLSQYLKSKPLVESLAERKKLCSQVLNGLSHLHTCSIVHGDLKMENVLVCSPGKGSGFVAKLSDFGHSIFVHPSDSNLTKLPGGTPPWNSPEWREFRQPKDFYKSDLYSAGLLIWAAFSIAEDPFNVEGHNFFSEAEFPFSLESWDRRPAMIETLKLEDKVLGMACRTTSATILSFGKGSRFLIGASRHRVQRDLPEELSIIFQNTLTFNPESRSLQPIIKILEDDLTPTNATNKENDISNEWPIIWSDPRQASPRLFGTDLLRGYAYTETPGAPTIARLSIAISEAIYFNESYTVEKRRDAAYFLFRSYVENYGVEEMPTNIDQASYWLHEFAKLGIASGTEQLCFFIEDITQRMGCNIPQDFPLEQCYRVGLQSVFQSGCYSLQALQQQIQTFPDMFKDVLSSFKEEGLRKFLPEAVRSTDLSMVLPTTRSEQTIKEAISLLHVAASCGDIKAASYLIETYGVDLNMKPGFGEIGFLITALKFSQTEFVLWLLRQGIKASLEYQAMPVLCFMSNFYVRDVALILKPLCEAGASLNDVSYFNFRLAFMNTLAFATWAFDLATIKLMLEESPSVLTCQSALLWACTNGRLSVVTAIESHLILVLKTPPTKSDWEQGLISATNISPYHKLFFPHNPNLVETMTYVSQKIGDLDPKILSTWLASSAWINNSESLCLCLEQNGSTQFFRRTKPFDIGEKAILNKSVLELSIIYDRKIIFDTLISKGAPIELEQAEYNFPTLLHIAAQRELLHSRYFCNTLLEKGDKLDVISSKALFKKTALELALRYNNYEVAKLLLNKGACIDGLDNDGQTPLGMLIDIHSRDSITGIDLLLEHPRASPSFVVDPEQGRTALHLASGPNYEYHWQYLVSIDEHEAVLDTILKYYSEPKHLNARDKCGFTALHHATYRGCDWAVKKLLTAGADPNLQSCIGLRPLDCTRVSRFLINYLEIMSPDFNISSPSNEKLHAAAKLKCLQLLTEVGAKDLEDALAEQGTRRYLLAAWGFINMAKDDNEPYEAWIGEFPLKIVTKWLAKRRNKRSQREKGKNKA